MFSLTEHCSVHDYPVPAVPGAVCCGMCMSCTQLRPTASRPAARLVASIQWTQGSDAARVLVLWIWQQLRSPAGGWRWEHGASAMWRGALLLLNNNNININIIIIIIRTW